MVGARGFFAGRALPLKVSGQGDIFSHYGAIHEMSWDLRPAVHADKATCRLRRIRQLHRPPGGGMKSTLFSGEGLVCTFTGPGRVLLQTRSEDAFLSWLIPHLPKSNNSSR